MLSFAKLTWVVGSTILFLVWDATQSLVTGLGVTSGLLQVLEAGANELDRVHRYAVRIVWDQAILILEI